MCGPTCRQADDGFAERIRPGRAVALEQALGAVAGDLPVARELCERES